MSAEQKPDWTPSELIGGPHDGEFVFIPSNDPPLHVFLSRVNAVPRKNYCGTWSKEQPCGYVFNDGRYSFTGYRDPTLQMERNDL